MREIKSLVNKVMDRAQKDRVIGKTVEASVTIAPHSHQLCHMLSSLLCQEPRPLDSSDYSLADVLVVADAQMVDHGVDGPYSATGEVKCMGHQYTITVDVQRSSRHQCPRCLRCIVEEEGSLCGRCHHVMNELS